MASFRPIEDPEDNIRGCRVLNALLSSSVLDRYPLVNEVWVAPGHCAITYSHSKRVIVFDSVPKSFRLIEHEQQRLLQSVRLQEFLRTVGVHILHEEYASSVCRVLFFACSGILRLMIVLENGEAHCWEWKPSDCVWIFDQKIVFSHLENFWKVVNAQYSPEKQKLFWRQDRELEGSPLFAEIFEISLSFSESDRSKEDIFEPKLIMSSLAHDQNTSLSTGRSIFQLGRDGLWIRVADSLVLWDMKEKLYSISDKHIIGSFYKTNNRTVSKDEGESITSSDSFVDEKICDRVSFVSMHSSGSELVVLDTSGHIYACYVFENRLRAKYLCTVALSSDNTSGDHKPGTFLAFAHRHWIGVVRGRSCALHHILTGVLLHTLPWPAAASSDIDSLSLWSHTGGGGTVGVWGRSGIWKLVSPRIHDELDTTAHSEGCGPLITASLCRDWGLRRIRAKYLVDYTVAVRNRVARKNAIQHLSKYLSNPSLLLAILPSPMFSNETVQELKTFLDRASSSPEGIMQTGSSSPVRAEVTLSTAARNALRYFTVLNQSSVTLLDACMKLSSPDRASMEANNLNNEKLEPSQLLSLSRGCLEAWCRRCPGTATPMLEILSSIRPITTLDAAHPDGHSIFELMCRGYYSSAPQKLLTFVRSVHVTAPPSYPAYWMHRALQCIPPPTSASSKEQIDVHVHLLGSCGQPHVALDLCLASGMWERAGQLVRAAKSHGDIEYNELLSTLFLYAAKHSAAHWHDAVLLTRTGKVASQFALSVLSSPETTVDDSEAISVSCSEYDGDILLNDGIDGLTIDSLRGCIDWDM